MESDPRRWGSASSPILFENLLIVPASAESEALVALDKKTGKEVWRQEASGLSNSWSTPVLARVDENRVDLVIGVARELWGLNPRTGKLRWYCEGVDSDSFSTSVVAHDGVVYAAEGQGGGSIAVRAGGKGNVTESHVLWRGRDASRFSTPIIHEGKLYSVSGDVMAVIDAKTGERISRARLRGGSGDGGGGRMGGDYSSPVLASGKIYFVKQSGDAFVLDIGGECRQLAVNRVAPEGESFQATPAISQGQIFLRSDKHLYCVADLGQEVPAEPVAKAADDEAEDDGEASGQDRRPGRGGDRGGSGRGGDRGGFDPQAIFDRSDADKNGKLEGDEIPERMRDGMDRIDEDKDGALTPEEFRKGMSRGGRPSGPRGGGRGSGGGGEAMKKPERPQRPEMDGS
jgi:hypothetical protein